MDLATLSLLLTRLGRLNEQFLADECRAHGTTPAEFQVLAVLRRHPSPSLGPTEIARRIVQTSGGLTATLRRLEEAGHVRRTPDPSDGRGRLVCLTGAGGRFHDRVFDDVLSRYAAIFADVDGPESLNAVRHLMAGLERGLDVPTSADWTADPPIRTTTGEHAA